MFKRSFSLLVACLLLVGCIPTSLANRSGGATAVQPSRPGVVSGRIVGLPAASYHAQAVDKFADYVKGAAVSIIEVSTGATVGTALTDANGAFQMDLGVKFTPVDDAGNPGRSVAYYLEAVKGVTGRNSVPNQVGSDVVRLRNIIWYDKASSSWVSIANGTPGLLTISMSTTAVCFYIGQATLNNMVINPLSYLGRIDGSLSTVIDPGTGTPLDFSQGATPLTVDSYRAIWLAVYNAFNRDQDPIASLIMDTSSSTPVPVNTNTEFSVVAKSPASGPINSTVTIQGLNFDKTAIQVYFTGDVQGTIDQANSSNSVLKVTVPPGARSGLIRVTLNGVSTYTDGFLVSTDDGHKTFFTDTSGTTTLYALSNAFGSLLKVDTRTGTTRTVLTGLSDPRTVIVNPEGRTAPPYRVYILNTGTSKILKCTDDGTTVTLDDASWLTASACSGMAIGPDGDLYIACYGNNNVLRARIDWAAGTVTTPLVATYTGVTRPSTVAFDYQGYGYLVYPADDMVRRFKPQAGDTGSIALTVAEPAVAPYYYGDWGVVPGPQGVTVDTAGNAFVTSQTNNVVFKIDPYRAMTAFTTLTSPKGISRDAQGNMYISDQSNNLIRRITLTGDQRIVAYGLASLRGMAADPAGNLYVSLFNSGAILKIASDRLTTSTLINGIAPPVGINYRNGNLYVAHHDTGTAPKPCCGGNDAPFIEEVTLAGAARSVITNPAWLYWPGAAEVSDDGATYYTGRVYGTWAAWPDSMWWYDTWERGGINITTPASASNQSVQRRAVSPGNYINWNAIESGIQEIDASNRLYVSPRRKLVLQTVLNGRDQTRAWKDLTPAFNSNYEFPSTTYDLVYDGSRYAYVACANKNIYRFDKQNNWALAGTISGFTGSGYPYGLAMSGTTLFVTDPANNRLYKVANASAATTLGTVAGTDYVAGFNAPAGITVMPGGAPNHAGYVMVSNYNTSSVIRVNPATMTIADHFTGLNGAPSRIRAYPDGRLVVRCSDGIFYLLTNAAAPGVSTYASTVGCTGCGIVDWFIDASSNFHWTQPYPNHNDGVHSVQHTHTLIRDGSNPNGNMLWLANSVSLYGMKLDGREDVAIADIGNVFSVAVNPTTHEVYAGNSGGNIYPINGSTYAIGTAVGVGGHVWGLAYSTSNSRLYAANAGDNSIYELDPTVATTWNKTQLKVGLNNPAF